MTSLMSGSVSDPSAQVETLGNTEVPGASPSTGAQAPLPRPDVDDGTSSPTIVLGRGRLLAAPLRGRRSCTAAIARARKRKGAALSRRPMWPSSTESSNATT